MTSGASGFLVAAILYGALAAFALLSRQTGRFGLAAIIASITTSLWAFGYAYWGPGLMMFWMEPLRLMAWLALPALLLNATSRDGSPGPSAETRTRGNDSANASTIELTNVQAVREQADIREPALTLDPPDWSGRRTFWLVASGLIITLVGVWASWQPLAPGPMTLIARGLLPSAFLGLSLTGLVLVERVYQCADPQRRRAVTLLCGVLVVLFVVDFLYYTDILLFRRIDAVFFASRGWIAVACCVPLAIGLVRLPERAMLPRKRRQSATGSAVTMFAGIYLLLVALVGFGLRAGGFSGQGPFNVVLGVLAAGLVALLVALPALRDRLRVTLTKRLFRYKYDYRNEWLTFTKCLTGDSRDAPIRILKGLTSIVDSSSGALWARAGLHSFQLQAARNIAGLDRLPMTDLMSLDAFLSRTGWLIDLDEFRRDPHLYEGLALPSVLTKDPSAWLIVPLPDGDGIIGFALIGRSSMLRRIDWEDRDLLKTAGYQGAAQLALYIANEALAEAREFDAFARTSAYVMHDLKNILGQQKLLVSNAVRHRHKPAFIDDVIETIHNSVNRMEALLLQLERRGVSGEVEPIPLRHVLVSICTRQAAFLPVPDFACEAEEATVLAERERLERVISHLVQNSQDATSDHGRLTVRLARAGRYATVTIEDDGEGMTEAFIRHELFTPFVSTKGLTGMGIGVFEAREYVRALGGDLTVESVPDVGTTFFMQLPVLDASYDAVSSRDTMIKPEETPDGQP